MSALSFSLDSYKDCERFANLIANLQSAAVEFQVRRDEDSRYVTISFDRK